MTTKTSPEERLLDALFGGLTEDEAKYLSRVMNRSDLTVERKRELFLKRFPDTKWMHHAGNRGEQK